MIQDLQFKPDLPEWGQMPHIRAIKGVDDMGGGAYYRNKRWVAAKEQRPFFSFLESSVVATGIDVVRAFVFKGAIGKGTIFVAGSDGSLYVAGPAKTGWNRVHDADENALRWEVVLYGTRFYATNGGLDEPLYTIRVADVSDTTKNMEAITDGYEIDSTTAVDTPPPTGIKKITIARNHLLAIYNDTRGAIVGWSQIDKPWEWTFGENLSDEQVLTDNSLVLDLVASEDAFVWTESEMYRLSYTGAPPVIWQVDKMASHRNLLATGAAALIGHNIFYGTFDGFYVFNGQTETAIGSGMVDDALRACLDQANRNSIYSFVNPSESEVWMCYATGSPRPTAAFIYNYVEGTWSHRSDIEGPYFEGYISPSEITSAIFITLGEIASSRVTWSAFEIGITFGSRIFQPEIDSTSGLIFSFNEDNILSSSAGRSRPVELVTNWFELKPNSGIRQCVRSVRPFTDALDFRATVELSESPSVDNIFSVNVSKNEFAHTGAIHVYASGRYARLKITLRDWNYFEGLDMDIIPHGMR